VVVRDSTQQELAVELHYILGNTTRANPPKILDSYGIGMVYGRRRDVKGCRNP
jgi:hypothetical protein